MTHTYVLTFENIYVFTHSKFGETFTNRINIDDKKEAKYIKNKSKLKLNVLRI